MPDGDRSSAEFPVAEPTEVEARPARSRARARRSFAIAVVVVLVIAALAIPIALRTSGSSPTHRTARRTPTTLRHIDADHARVAVSAALAATLASQSYHASSTMNVSPGMRGVSIAAEAIVNLDPPAMAATATLGASAHYSSWTDGNRQWEGTGTQGGFVPPLGMGVGQPISSFNGIVVSTLGPREGGVAMMSLASPAGYFDLAGPAITSASATGTVSRDGVQLTEYAVTVDAAELVHRPGMTPEQVTAATVAIAELRGEGYRDTAVRVDVDAAGYVRIAHADWRFADGGAVTTDTTYTDYGCAGTVVLPGQQSAAPREPTCTSPDTTPVTTATAATATTVTAAAATTAPASTSESEPFMRDDTTTPSGPDRAAIQYAFGHFFDPALTADQRAALIQGSGAIRAFIDASFTKHEAEAAAGAILVDSVDIQGPRAAVTFHALLGSGESPANPGELNGVAVFEDGTWKISRATYCTLSANDGEVCPPA